MISVVYRFEHPGRSKRETATETQPKCWTQVGACPLMSFFVSIDVNNLILSTLYTSETSLQNDPYRHPSSLFPLLNPYHAKATLFPYVFCLSRYPTLVYRPLVLSHASPMVTSTPCQESKRSYLPMTFLRALLSTWACPCHARACLLKWPRFFVANLYSNSLIELGTFLGRRWV